MTLSVSTGEDILVRGVVALQVRELLERERRSLGGLRTIGELRRWAEELVELDVQQGSFGGDIGSIVALAPVDADERTALAEGFKAWRDLIAAGLMRMQHEGTLRNDIGAEDLATGLMAAMQGGYLLMRTARDARPMRIALDMALDHIETFACP
ncbi:LmrA/YxaF family transcription factor [Streptomyces sp. NBC_01497]|uniref:LmrA/YxaF family transcription factor n=1 Tax=Streptomyces sp. NBC_01497 TaxID=2903885 RepID=UPI002E30D65B|nr:TetR family transcriptional regulator C-terminal domain-containing protein [Streptomyces sp. NBC_01497]